MFLFAQQKTAEELTREAAGHEFQGYVFAIAAFVILAIGVGLSVYLDRRKKAATKR
jgi:hypothetical protein